MVSSSAFGQGESEARHSFWAGVDVGGAQLKRTYTVSPSTSESTSSFRVRAGYSPNPRLLLGLEFGGWNIESSGAGILPDPSPNKGEGIETFFAVVRYFPLERSLVFVESGLGFVSYWNNRPLEQGANGSGAFLGVGHDFQLSRRLSLAPSIDYSWGHIATRGNARRALPCRDAEDRSYVPLPRLGRVRNAAFGRSEPTA